MGVCGAVGSGCDDHGRNAELEQQTRGAERIDNDAGHAERARGFVLIDHEGFEKAHGCCLSIAAANGTGSVRSDKGWQDSGHVFVAENGAPLHPVDLSR